MSYCNLEAIRSLGTPNANCTLYRNTLQGCHLMLRHKSTQSPINHSVANPTRPSTLSLSLPSLAEDISCSLRAVATLPSSDVVHRCTNLRSMRHPINTVAEQNSPMLSWQHERVGKCSQSVRDEGSHLQPMLGFCSVTFSPCSTRSMAFLRSSPAPSMCSLLQRCPPSARLSVTT